MHSASSPIRHHASQQSESTPFFTLAAPREMQGGFYIVLITLLSSLSGFLFGYDTGVISGALLAIRRDFQLSEWQQECIVSIATVGAVVGSLAGGHANERAGRRPVILLSSIIFTFGAIIMGSAPNYVVLTIGRFVIGLAIGFSSMTIPIYIAEAAPSAIRGRLVTLNCIFITGGQFIAGMVDGVFSDVEGGWRYMLGIAAIPAVIQFFGILFMPESPRWLVAKDRAIEARQVLEKMRASMDVDFEMAEIEEDVSHSAELPEAGWQDLWAAPPIRRAVILGCGLMFLQQLSGINTVMYYSASIYNMAGFSDSSAIWLAGFTALAQFLGMIGNMMLVEKWGRRTLVLSSLAMVCVSLIAIGLSFYLAMISSTPATMVDPACTTVSNYFVHSFEVHTCYRCVQVGHCGFCPALNACLSGNATTDHQGICPAGGWAFEVCDNSYGYMSVVSMVLYLFTFGIGMGAMPWTINSEIYPLHVRSVANSLATSVNWIGNVAISATFLSIASPHFLNQYGAFWLYAIIAIAGFAGLWFTLPETKGVPLEEIEELFTKPLDRSGRGSSDPTAPLRPLRERLSYSSGASSKVEAPPPSTATDDAMNGRH